jgi:hypothetical protein
VKITINTNDKTIIISEEQFPMTFQEAGYDPNSDCESNEDHQDCANDWANNKGYVNSTIEIV